MAWRNGVAVAALGVALLAAGEAGKAQTNSYDLLIRSGTIYDGSGGKPYVGDVGIKGDRIVYVGPSHRPRREEGRRQGLAVAPGFINMLSWATESLIVDAAGKATSVRA